MVADATRFRTSETVVIDTPASFATSLMVIRLDRGLLGMGPFIDCTQRFSGQERADHSRDRVQGMADCIW